MTAFPPSADGVRLSRRQGLGCLGVGAFGLGIAVLCLVLGIRCMAKHDAFECIGLWTVFPLVFAVIGLASLAVGLQRFTAAGRETQAATAPPGLGDGPKTVAPRVAPRKPRWMPPPAVIHLPATMRPEDGPEATDDGPGRQ